MPVAIEAAHTGVTDGNAATQSSTCWPRSISSCSVGARPLAIARSSIAGFIASMTTRTSFFTAEIRRPAYFSPARRRRAQQQPRQGGDHEDGERREEDREAGADQRGGLAVERQHRLRLGVEPAPRRG